MDVENTSLAHHVVVGAQHKIEVSLLEAGVDLLLELDPASRHWAIFTTKPWGMMGLRGAMKYLFGSPPEPLKIGIPTEFKTDAPWREVRRVNRQYTFRMMGPESVFFHFYGIQNLIDLAEQKLQRLKEDLVGLTWGDELYKHHTAHERLWILIRVLRAVMTNTPLTNWDLGYRAPVLVSKSALDIANLADEIDEELMVINKELPEICPSTLLGLLNDLSPQVLLNIAEIHAHLRPVSSIWICSRGLRTCAPIGPDLAFKTLNILMTRNCLMDLGWRAGMIRPQELQEKVEGAATTGQRHVYRGPLFQTLAPRLSGHEGKLFPRGRLAPTQHKVTDEALLRTYQLIFWTLITNPNLKNPHASTLLFLRKYSAPFVGEIFCPRQKTNVPTYRVIGNQFPGFHRQRHSDDSIGGR